MDVTPEYGNKDYVLIYYRGEMQQAADQFHPSFLNALPTHVVVDIACKKPW